MTSSEDKYYLVTTNIQDTWCGQHEAPVFLGDWCFGGSFELEKRCRDSQKVPYHWDDRKKLNQDHERILKYYYRILDELANALNNIHGIQENKRYWLILLGPWLEMYLQILFDRYENLATALKIYEKFQLKTVDNVEYSFVPHDLEQFSFDILQDSWNEFLYRLIIETVFIDKVQVHKVKPLNKREKNHVNVRKYSWKENFLRTYKKLLINENDKYYAGKVRISKNFAYKHGMMKLLLPKLYSKDSMCSTSICYKMRNELAKNLKATEVSCNFELVVKNLISEFLPTSYLENYFQLVKTSVADKPTHPKNIFSSTSHVSDDMFNAYCANKTRHGAKLIILQHGGSDGLTPIHPGRHGVDICDEYWTWGRSDFTNRVIKPFGNFVYADKSVRRNPDGPLTVFQYDTHRYAHTVTNLPISGQWLKYFENQKQFVSGLKEQARKNLCFRLKTTPYGWLSKERYEESFPDIEASYAKDKSRSALSNSRMAICTYNGTTIAEAMLWNFPVIIYWNPELNELNQRSEKIFKELENLGVFYTCAQSAAMKINEIYCDIDDWWNSDNVMKARQIYLHEYFGEK